MAAYPSVVQAYGSFISGSDGTVVERSVSGKSRFRTYYTQTREVIRMFHDLDDTDKGLIETHYGTDKLLSFTLTFDADGSTPTVKYANAPQYKPIKGGRWKVIVDLIVV